MCGYVIILWAYNRLCCNIIPVLPLQGTTFVAHLSIPVDTVSVLDRAVHFL